MTKTIVKNLGETTGEIGLQYCDRCTARAKVCMHKNDLMLLFCGHHYGKLGTVMVNDGWSVVEMVDA